MKLKNLVAYFIRPRLIFIKISSTIRYLLLKKNYGFCLICEKNTKFIEYGKFFRDDYLSACCKSIPRERAFFL
jgi:hypothetical protein